MKLAVVLGEGGHSVELLKLVQLLGNQYDYHYIMTKEDNLSSGWIPYPGPRYLVNRPRGKATCTITSIFRTILAAGQSLYIMLRIRPRAVITAGPAIAVPVSIVGKMLGAQIIFIETASRIKSISLTAKIIYRWADLFIVQWPDLAQNIPKAVFAGRLL